mmetsp:Transcript_21655/g.53419  ORF Transcript_21655/g.53419 Transcript_21655/m.53419 type:complete len:250 (+) Transcript_21655:944-1693(+)
MDRQLPEAQGWLASPRHFKQEDITFPPLTPLSREAHKISLQFGVFESPEFALSFEPLSTMKSDTQPEAKSGGNTNAVAKTRADASPPGETVKDYIELQSLYEDRYKALLLRVKRECEVAITLAQQLPTPVAEESDEFPGLDQPEEWDALLAAKRRHAIERLKAGATPYRKQRLDGDAKAILKNWAADNDESPYPEDHEKERLAKETGFTIQQVILVFCVSGQEGVLWREVGTNSFWLSLVAGEQLVFEL